MNKPQKNIAQLLMSGCYLAKRGKRWVLFKGNAISVQFVKEKHLKPFKILFKKDKWMRITLNLSEVRKLHGNSFLKKLYRNKQQFLNSKK